MSSYIIVGGGVSAASIVYQLYSLPDFKGKVLLLESGEVGRGNKTEFATQENYDDDSFGEEMKYKPWKSGSNVYDNPGRIKMIVTIFPSTAKEFLRHHGMKGLKLYNKLASIGRDTEIKLADSFLNKPHNYTVDSKTNIPDDAVCIQLGSLMVCHSEEEKELLEEFEILKEGGFEVEWWSKEKVESVHGKEASFSAGIFFPKDGVINSNLYAKKLIEFGVNKGLEVRENTHVREVEENIKDGKVKVVLDNQEILFADKVIIATGGLFLSKELSGILKPCYSYLSGIKNDKIIENPVNSKDVENSKNTPNFFTYGFSHDWAMSQGYLRISGEDHFSALKNPRMEYRCKNLENWAKQKYPFLEKSSEVKYEVGVYSETPDILPLVGSVSDNSNIYYLVGCNAWGQASMSGAAHLIPALLGERKIEKEEKEMIKFLTIRRFKLHGSNRPKF